MLILDLPFCVVNVYSLNTNSTSDTLLLQWCPLQQQHYICTPTYIHVCTNTTTHVH